MLDEIGTLITEPYRDEQRRLHATAEYGQRGAKWLETVTWLAMHYRAGSILDYGCGRGTLGNQLRAQQSIVDVRDYDPAVPGKDAPPATADLVVCTDVLEHIEPECLIAVLDHLRYLTRRALFLVVNLTPTHHRLSDGRNAHLIQQNALWWQDRFHRRGWVEDQLTMREMPIPTRLRHADKASKFWLAVLEHPTMNPRS
jgi:hypothetical protein